MTRTCNSKKGQIWISAILYTLIISVVITMVLQAGLPVLNELQDKSIFMRSKDSFLALNQHIQDVSEEGKGSQRVVPIEIEKGNLAVESGVIQWDMSTNANILESGSEIELGNLFMSSNADVYSFSTNDTYTLGNNMLEANFTRCEDVTTCMINSSEIIKSLAFVYGNDNEVATGTFGFEFGSGPWSYRGYSRLEDRGMNQGSATVVYYVDVLGNSVFTAIEFKLGSNRDFLEVKIR